MGTAVEEADTVDFNREAALRHPYTRALFRAMPEHGFAPEPGIQPYVRDLPEGCPYGPRCPKYKTECSKEVSYVPYQGDWCAVSVREMKMRSYLEYYRDQRD